MDQRVTDGVFLGDSSLDGHCSSDSSSQTVCAMTRHSVQPYSGGGSISPQPSSSVIDP